MTPGPFLSLAAAGLVLGIVFGPAKPRTWLALTLAAAALSLAAAMLVLAGAGDWEWVGGFRIGGELPHLRLDGLSAIFIALLAVVGGSGAAYSREYWSDKENPRSAPRGRLCWSAMLLSMGLVLLSSNGLHFLIAWEVFTICGYFLITLDRERRDVRAAGWLYLAASHAGTMCLFAFFALLASKTGGWELGPMRGQAELAPLFWLALAGFGLKAGMFPLHIWLPSAHSSAPSHVSALLSGVALKLGIYGIVRFSGWLPVPAFAGWVVIALGATSALLGVAFALAQNDIKRLLAYCSVENIGVILIGIGAALLAEEHGNVLWGRLALAGALLHVWNHGLFKALLFMGAGSVLHATGTREMSRLGGLWRLMPWTAGLFALGSVAISGLPPLNGFVSEWLVYLGLFDAVIGRGPAAWAAMLAIIVLGVAGAMALASFMKACSVVFLGAARTQVAEHAHECGGWMRAPMLLLAGLSMAIGLAPVFFWPAISRALTVWQPEWTSVEAPAPLWTLTPVQGGLAIILCAAAVWLWRLTRTNGLRRGPTWDCGYAAPTARMQYTGGSFAGIASGWFYWILQPDRKLRRPRGVFPVESSCVEHVPETVLDRVISPAGEVVMQLSTAVRRLQHGRLQLYIVYLLAGLAGLVALVLIGGKP